MDKCKHLIIGAGPAALAAAQAIRSADKNADITLVTRENSLPYSPAVLPYMLSAELAEEDLFGKGREFLAKMNVTFVRGKEVAEILPATNEVRYTCGERQPYDKLLIATGSSPQVPPVENLLAGDFHTFRTYSDFERLSKTLDQKQVIAIYGAGLVAVEAAEKLCLAGHTVVIIARSTLLRKYFSPHNVAVLEQAFREHGGKVLTKTSLVSVQKTDDRLELLLSSGEKLTVDRLIVATGVAANKLEGGLLPVVDGGLKVGRNMETNVPNIYAAGDVAAAPSFFDSQNAPCPILPEAVFQGRVAGANMAGEPAVYKGWISGNYLRCFDDNLFSIGVTGAESAAGYVMLEKNNGSSSLKLIMKDNVLVGAEGLNMKSIHPGVFLYLIRERVSVKKYRDLLLSKPGETACWLMLEHRKSQAI